MSPLWGSWIICKTSFGMKLLPKLFALRIFLGVGCCFLWVWYTSPARRALFFLVVGPTTLYPRNCCYITRGVCPNISSEWSHQIAILKSAETSITIDLTVLRRTIDFFVVLNWVCSTDAVEDEMIWVLSSCGIPYRNLSSTPYWLRNVHQRYNLSYCLVTISSNIDSFVLRVLLKTTS